MRKRTTSQRGRRMDLRTAAEYLGCSYWTLRDLVLNGHIPAVRIPSPRARDGRVMRRILIDCAISNGSSNAGKRQTTLHTA
jgi:excisionase family DNA binding protein